MPEEETGPLRPDVTSDSPSDAVPSPLHPPAGADPGASSRPAPDCAPQTEITAGRLIGGRYEVRERHREGGMGVIYKVVDTRLADRVCALKMIKSGMNLMDMNRFRDEVIAMGKLDHPHIVPIYDFDRDPMSGGSYCVMKWVEGDSLMDFLDHGGWALDARDKVRDFIPVAEAVHEAHERGIVHRDIKTRNVLVDRDGRYLLSDFGLAQVGRREPPAPSDTPDGIANNEPLTERSTIVGTIYYMSPEQALAQDVPAAVSPASDIYGLGVVLYELVTGEVPIGGTDAKAFLDNLYRGAPIIPPGDRVRGLPRARDLDAICLKAMARQPAERYATAMEFADDLKRYLAYRPVQARRTGRFERLRLGFMRRRAVVIPTAVAAALAVGFAGWMAHASRQRRGQIRDALAKAALAERGEKWTEAGEAYRAALMLDAADAEARAGLARIDKKLKIISTWGQ